MSLPKGTFEVHPPVVYLNCALGYRSDRQWCRPKVANFVGSHRGCSDSSSLQSTSDTLLIRNGRFPIDLSDASGFKDDDGPPEHLPNDSYSSSEKPFTVITGINGMLSLW